MVHEAGQLVIKGNANIPHNEIQTPYDVKIVRYWQEKRLKEQFR